MPLTPSQQQFLQELDDNPAFAEAVRDRLLTKELMALPDMFAKFVETTNEFNKLVTARLDRLEEDVSELKAGQARLEAGQTALEAGQTALNTRMNRVEGILGNLSGEKYERTATKKMLFRAVTDLEMDNVYIATAQQPGIHSVYQRTLFNARKSGVLSIEELAEITEADAIISDEDNRHAVVEFSLGPDGDDVTRARERATLWAQATGGEVTPVVATPDPREDFVAAAKSQGVTVLSVSQ